MYMARRDGKRKTGLKLLLLVVLVMCGLLTYNKGKAVKEEKALMAEKEAYESVFDSKRTSGLLLA